MFESNIGSSFDSFLQEGATLEEATKEAIERIVAWVGADAPNDSELAADSETQCVWSSSCDRICSIIQKLGKY